MITPFDIWPISVDRAARMYNIDHERRLVTERYYGVIAIPFPRRSSIVYGVVITCWTETKGR